MNSFVASRKRYLFTRKYKDASVQTEFCNPIHILIDKIRKYNSTTLSEKENVEKTLEALNFQHKELTLMVKLFQMGYLVHDSVQSLEEIQETLSNISDPIERELFCEKSTLNRQVQEAKTIHCEMVMELKSRGVDKDLKEMKVEKTSEFIWDDCFKDFVKVEQEEKLGNSKNLEMKSAYCHNKNANEIMDLTLRNSAVLKMLWLYKQMYRNLFSSNQWTPQVFLNLKNFLNRQKCIDYKILRQFGMAESLDGSDMECKVKSLPPFLRSPKNRSVLRVWKN